MVFLVAGSITLAFAAGLAVGRLPGATEERLTPLLGASNSRGVDMGKFWTVWDLAQDQYVEQPVDNQVLLEGAIAGLLDSLKDPYSTYFNQELAQEFNQEIAGSFFGIGAELGLTEEGIVSVISPIEDTPAAQAGLQAGDLIAKIDGVDTYGFSIPEAVSKIRGPKDTDVTLTLVRGAEGPFDVTITRGEITIKSVKLEWQGQVAIFRISMFNEDTATLFTAAAAEVVAQGATGVVIDMRNNPGGLLNAAVEVAGHFVGRQVVVRESFEGGESELVSRGQAELAGIPTVVLVNGGSASAAEILAGALQDHGLARVVGTKTFGKGTVQDYQELPDGSAVKITVARWLTPKGRAINKEGIVPDVEIPFDPSSVSEKDSQLDQAIRLLTSR
jgi:carboxyl-terminal processing protease